MEYPKIETVFVRADDNPKHVAWGLLRCPEFSLVRTWHVTEKIDGTNIRVLVDTDGEGRVVYLDIRGRTDDAQTPEFLMADLRRLLNPDTLAGIFDPDTEAVLYGEGYGPKIQRGGGNYRRDDRSFRLFDVAVRAPAGRLWWLEWENVEGIAAKVGVKTVPVIGEGFSLERAVAAVDGPSYAALEDLGGPDAYQEGFKREGIVARTRPLLFDRRGGRVMWKLKGRDLP